MLRCKSGSFVAMAAFGLGFGAQEGWTQDSQRSDASTLQDEIVVTAQKREQVAQDVGISLTALSGDQIDALGYTETTDVVQQVPSVQFQSTTTFSTVNIRGVSQTEFTDQHEGPVSINMDGVYISSPGAVRTQVFDLERVEVLRGPQGTLFGRNSNGGLINFVTRRPTTDFDARAELSYGSYNQTRFEGAISGPLGGEQLLGRLSVGGNFHDGYLENRIGKDLNDTRTWGVRGQLLWRPTSRFEALFKAQASVNADDAAGGYSHQPAELNADGLGEPINGPDLFGYQEPDDNPHTGSIDFIGFFDRKAYEGMAQLAWDFDRMSLTSVTHYYKHDKTYAEDVDASPNSVFVYRTWHDLQQFSQELRLNGSLERLNWTLGAYYLDIDSNGASDVDLLFLPGRIRDERVDTTRSLALFGQLEYEFAPRWKALLGLRSTRDTKRINGQQLYYDFFVDVLEVPPVIPIDQSTLGEAAKQTYENWQGKAQIEFRPIDDVLVYAGVSRGTKAGGFQGAMTTIVDDFVFDEEVLTSYEVGFKSTFADDRVRLNGSAFYYDYKDYQAFLFDPVAFAANILNRDAEVRGLELELVARPTNRFEFSLGASFLDTTVPNITLPGGRVVNRELPQAPDFSLSGLARYVVPLSTGADLSFQADFNYNSDFFFTVLNSPVERERAYTVANLRIGYDSADGRWGVALFGRNVFNERYRMYSLDLAGDFGISNDRYAPPAWYGVTVQLRH